MVCASLAGCGKSAGSGSGPSAASDPGVAATVNGEPITVADFNAYMGMKETVQVFSRRGIEQMHVAGTFGVQTMEELVNQKILMDMAKDQGVLPTDKDVDDELAFQTRLRPDYVTIQQQSGASMDSIRHELMVGLAREHLIMKGVKVGDREVDGYIKAHPDRFVEPATADVLFIEASTSARQSAVDAALAKGEKFGEVAVKLSEDPHAKESGGLFGQRIIQQMPKEVQSVVNATSEGQASAWVKFGTHSVKFFITKKTPATHKEPSVDQREILRRQLAMQQGQARNNFDEEFYKRLKAAKVDVEVPYLKGIWQRSWEQLLDPTGGQTPTAPPPKH